MKITNRIHSNSSVDKAGRQLLNSDNDEVHAILREWRGLHAYPLQSTVDILTDVAQQVDPGTIVAQRLKRLPSIKLKLQNQSQMALTQMQDIAGCRAVVSTAEDVYAVKEKFEQATRSTCNSGPQLIAHRTKDYIMEPKVDGYRSVHLICRYVGATDGTSPFEGLRIEIQIRSRLQHAWAMAVETASSVTDQALKAGRGKDDWLRFFRLISSAIALEEHLPTAPYTPDESTLFSQIKMLSKQLRVVSLFQAMSHAVSSFGPSNLQATDPNDMYLLTLDARKQRVSAVAFGKQESLQAVALYDKMERRSFNDPDVHVVLVSIESLTSLRDAYPSYFLDAESFVNIVKKYSEFGLARGAGLDPYGWASKMGYIDASDDDSQEPL